MLVTFLSGCGGTATTNPFSAGRGAPTTLQIFVDNQNFNDLAVLAITTRGRQPLGRVGGASSRTFSMDWRGLDELRIRIEFLADQEYETNRINASPGDLLELIIPRDPRQAYIRRRR